MEKSLNPLNPNSERYSVTEDESECKFKCDECRTEFRKPILATISSQNGIEKYYACPRCLTKVAEPEEVVEHPEKPTRPKSIKETSEKANGDVGCTHSVGYLRTRPKNAPIPEECLTCDKMVDCMLR